MAAYSQSLLALTPYVSGVHDAVYYGEGGYARETNAAVRAAAVVTRLAAVGPVRFVFTMKDGAATALRVDAGSANNMLRRK